MNQEEMIRAEVERQLNAGVPEEKEPNALKSHLYSLGGGTIGAGLGLASINPIDYFVDKRIVRDDARLTRRLDELAILDEINRGKLTFDKIPDEADRKHLKMQFDLNKDLLDNPKELDELLNKNRKGNVYSIDSVIESPRTIEAMKGRLARNVKPKWLPSLDVLGRPGLLTHPAVSIGALAGMTGGYVLADHLGKKKDT